MHHLANSDPNGKKQANQLPASPTPCSLLIHSDPPTQKEFNRFRLFYESDCRLQCLMKSFMDDL